MGAISTSYFFTYENRWIHLEELRKPDDPHVYLLKKIKSEFLNPSEAWKREDSLNQLLDSIPKLHKTSEQTRKDGRVYRINRGTSLLGLIQENKLEMDERVRIASDLILILLRVHEKKYLFCDLNPALFWCDLIDEQTLLLDTLTTVSYNLLNEHYSSVIGIEPDMNCMSPEHSIYSNSNFDFRSNYYSLGVILYALFTGQFPLKGYDRLSVLHKHMSQLPSDPRNLNSDLSAAMSGFVMKLLAKDPEERYQSSAGLLADFKSCQNLQDKGDLETLPELGIRDFPAEFIVPRSVFTRPDKQEILKALVHEFNSKGKSMTLISGKSGAGVSYLLESFFETLNYDQYYLGSGKESSDHNIPFKALRDATSDILNQILMEDPLSISELKQSMEADIKNLSGVLIDFSKDFEYLFESRAPIEELSGKASINRFIYAYSEFLRLLELQGKSIILSLEYFEYTDVGTSQLIQHLLKSSAIRNSFFIIALNREEVRQNEHCQNFLEGTEPKNEDLTSFHFEELIIENYNKEELRGILEILKMQPKEALADILFEKTQGNASFVRQFFQELGAQNCIRPNYDNQVWEVDLTELSTINISGNLEEFLTARTAQLPESELNLLMAAASIGEEIEVQFLLEMHGGTRSEAESLIDSLRIKGFFTPLEYHHARLIKIRFSHRGFVEILLKEMGIGQLEKFKLQLVQALLKLLDGPQINARIYELVSHLMPLRPEKCLPFKMYLEKAAHKAKRETAFENASRYFEKLSEIHRIPESGGGIDELFENHYQATLTSLYAINYSRYKVLFEELEELVLNKVQRYRLFLLRAIEKVQRGDYPGTLKVLETGMRQMKVAFSLKITRFQIIRMFIWNLWITRNWDTEKVLEYPIDDDEFRGIYQRLINISAPAVYFLKPQLTSRLTYIGIKNTAKHGLCKETPYHLIAFAFQINGFSDQVDKAHKMSEISFELMEKRVYSAEESIPLNFLYNSFVRHTLEPLSKCISGLAEYYKKGRELGNISVAHYCLGMNRWYQLFKGTPLNNLSELLNASHRLSQEENQVLIVQFHRLMKALVEELTRGSFTEKPLQETGLPITWKAIEDAAIRENRILFANLIMIRLIIEMGQNRVTSEPELIKKLLQTIKDGGHGPYNAIVHIFYALLHHFRSELKTPAISSREENKFMNVLKARMEKSPENYRVKYLILKGLRAKKKGKKDEALQLMNEAQFASSEFTNVWDRAIAEELLGLNLLENGFRKSGMKMLSQALESYSQWGATSICERIISDFPELRDQNNNATRSQDQLVQESTKNENIRDVVRLGLDALQLDDANLEVIALLEKITEIAMAEKSCFLIQNERGLIIYAFRDGQDPVQIIDKPLDDEFLPASVVRLVVRRKKILQIGDASNSSQYRADPYIVKNKVRSILCIPFLKAGTIKSVLYLENNHLKDFFSSKDIQLIQWLFVQLAYSIDNSMLTDQLEERLKQRSQQIIQERDRVNRLITNILPKKIAEELKTQGRVRAQKFDNASVLFTDFKDFTIFSESMTAEQIIFEIDDCFRAFDRIIEKHGLEKIKTIGDAYMCAGGVPEPNEGHEFAIVKAGLEMLDYMEISNLERKKRGIKPLHLRVGIHAGPLIAGVVGSIKYAYDIWGPTVNIAARMESSGEAGMVNISGSMYLKVKEYFNCTYRGRISAKNIGEIDMYFIKGAR